MPRAGSRTRWIGRGLVAIAALGCAPDDPVEDDVFVPVDAQAIPAEDAVVGPAEQAWVLGGGRWLGLDSDQLVLHDVRQAEALAVPQDQGVPRAAAWVQDRLLLATDDGLWSLDQELEPSPLTEVVEGPVRSVASDGRDLWLLTDAPLRWREGVLVRVSIDAPVQQAIPGVPAADGPLTWMVLEQGLAALDERLEAVDAVDAPGLTSAAVGVDGAVWVADEHGLAVRIDGRQGAGTWLDVDLPPDAQLLAHPASERVWIVHDGAAWTGTTDGLAPVEAPGELLRDTVLGVDDHGRLAVLSGDQVHRLSVQPTARLLDVPALLTGATDVLVDVGRADRVEQVSLRLGDSESTLSGPPFVGTLDPAVLPDNTAEALVRATVTWSDGSTRVVQQDVAIGEGVSWERDIGPLAEDRCGACHGEGTDTPLHTAQQWQDRFADIQAQVASGAMPLSGDPLSGVERDLLQAWSNAGFP